MSLSEIFNITGSALSAQTIRLNTTASNLANVDAIAGSAQDVYKARYPVFQTAFLQASGELSQFSSALSGQSTPGVKVTGIVESTATPVMRHQPDHPLADADGNIYVANINMVEEMTNMIEASRSYQTNIQVANTAKQLIQQTLRLGS